MVVLKGRAALAHKRGGGVSGVTGARTAQGTKNGGMAVPSFQRDGRAR